MIDDNLQWEPSQKNFGFAEILDTPPPYHIMIGSDFEGGLSRELTMMWHWLSQSDQMSFETSKNIEYC